MDDIAWYAEASLSANMRVLCAGTLVQCVRRWTLLSEGEQSLVIIKVGSHTDVRKVLTQDQVWALARHPDVFKSKMPNGSDSG
jgi:hypothetical protein